jgi:hypothetical protein
MLNGTSTGSEKPWGGEMRTSQHKEPKLLAVLLDAMGGELLAGSGFEKEDPEQDYSITELAVLE